MGCGFESHRAYVGDAFLYAGVRTPFGRYAGALAGSRPDDLAAAVVREIVDRAPGLDPADVDDVILGCANGAGEDNRNVGRMAVLLAGLPVSRARGHREPALRQQPRRRPWTPPAWSRRATRTVVIAGGVESMTPRTVGAAEAGASRSPPATRRWCRRRSAGGWSTPGCPRSGPPHWASATSSSPTRWASAGTGRTPSR